jgi:hypothetical protein
MFRTMVMNLKNLPTNLQVYGPPSNGHLSNNCLTCIYTKVTQMEPWQLNCGSMTTKS